LFCRYLQSHMAVLLRGASGLMDENLLSYYQKEWVRFTAALRYVNHIFSYLNRHWIKREAEDGKKEVYEVNILGLVVWRDHLFREVKGRLTKALLDQLERDRNGEQINAQLVAGVIEGYVRLGLNRERPKELTLDVYREDFEVAFLAETHNFYARESVLFIAENSVSDYLKKVLSRLAQEVKRGSSFTHQSSHAQLTAVCEKAMIEKHVATIQNEAAGFFVADKVEDLGNLYQLLVRVPGALDPVRQLCEKHIHAMGVAELESVAKVRLSLGFC
jgi:cullin 1